MLSQARVYVTLLAEDLERARAFYKDKLGLLPSQEYSWALVYELEGGTRFSLFRTPNPARGGHTQMGFAVTDLRAEVGELKKRSVVFEEYDAPNLKTIDGVADMEGRSAAWFKDTEGNVIELLELG
jgi:catechol 2,3-dioxygenase-like lactoylglutathione lyase family enzyme